MKFKFSILICVFTHIFGHEQNDFIADYFTYKNVSNIIGFSCNDDNANGNLAKQFHKLRIRTAFPKLNAVTNVQYLVNSKYWKLGVFLDTYCYSVNRIKWLFSEASDKRLYGEIHYWLVLGPELEAILNMIDDKSFGLSTDFIVALPMATKFGGGYKLYDVYNPWKDGGCQMNITLLGYWNKEKGLKIIISQSKLFRRSNLHGISMKASFFGSKYRPKNVAIEDYLQDYATKSKDGLSKFGFIILIHFSEMFNITFHFGEAQKWKEGDTVGPLSRALLLNEIQITGSPVVMTIERLKLIKYVYPTWPFRTCFIFRNPQPHNIKINEILRPFANDSWYMAFIFIIIFFITLALTLKYESEDLSNFLYSNSFLIVIGTFCQQGTNYTMNSISSRIVFMYLLIFSILIYNYYSASIVSARLNEPIFKINDSLIELAKTDLTLGSEPMIYFEFIMKRILPWEKELFYNNRWMKIPKNEKFLYPEKGVPLVQQGGFAYHTHPDVSYPIIDRTFSFREICELMEVHPQPPSFATIAVTYNSSFVEITKVGFARISEVGIRHRQVMRWSSSKPRCRNDVMNVSSTDIYEFAPHLIILLIGMLCSIVLLVCEILIGNFIAIKQTQGYNRNRHSTVLLFIDLLSKIK